MYKGERGINSIVVAIIVVTIGVAVGAVFFAFHQNQNSAPENTEPEVIDLSGTVEKSSIVKRIKNDPGIPPGTLREVRLVPGTVEIISVTLENWAGRPQWKAEYTFRETTENIFGVPLENEKKLGQKVTVWKWFWGRTGAPIQGKGERITGTCPVIVKHYDNGENKIVTWREDGYLELLRTAEENSALSRIQPLENSDLKVESWELLLGPLPSPGAYASYGLLEGRVTVVNDGERPFYVTKLMVSADNQLADGVPGSPVEPEEILVEPGENKSVKMYFEDSRSGLSYKIDMGFSYYLDNFTYREIQQDERWVDLKLIARTPENENLVATKTGTIRPAKSGFQSVGSKRESPENENFPSLCGTCGVPKNGRSPPEVVTWLGENRIFFFATDVNWGENWQKIRGTLMCFRNGHQRYRENQWFKAPIRSMIYPPGRISLQSEVWERNSNHLRFFVNDSFLTPITEPRLLEPVDQYVRDENLKMGLRLVGDYEVLDNGVRVDPADLYYERTFPQKLKGVIVENWDDLHGIVAQIIPPVIGISPKYTVALRNTRDESYVFSSSQS